MISKHVKVGAKQVKLCCILNHYKTTMATTNNYGNNKQMRGHTLNTKDIRK